MDDLATVWCEWAELELRAGCEEAALKLMARATATPPRPVAYHDEAETVQARVYKSIKLWCLYADLEESFGTFKVKFFFTFLILFIFKKVHHDWQT